MSVNDSTCWTVIQGAAAGNAPDRDRFARRYLPAVRAYLSARWSRTPLRDLTEDAVQEVFLECFRGVLSRADPSRSFRALLYGVVRNVARRHEKRRHDAREQPASALSGAVAPDDSPDEAFDRTWAGSLMELARERQQERARDDEAIRRVELLELRFEDALPIREIARRWAVEPAWLHHEYAKARREFKRALMGVVAEHQPGRDEEVEAECSRLLDFFS